MYIGYGVPFAVIVVCTKLISLCDLKFHIYARILLQFISHQDYITFNMYVGTYNVSYLANFMNFKI